MSINVPFENVFFKEWKTKSLLSLHFRMTLQMAIVGGPPFDTALMYGSV